MKQGEVTIRLKSRFCPCPDSVGMTRSVLDDGRTLFKCCGCNRSTTTKGWLLEFEEDLKKTKDSQTVTRKLTPVESELLDIIRSEQSGIVEKLFDDGFYWFNLETKNSPYEARLMKHCGKDNAGILWSLRDSKKKPHLTITVDSKGMVVDIRARHNKRARQRKYGKYIAAILAAGCIEGVADGLWKK